MWALHLNYHQHNYNRTPYIQRSHSSSIVEWIHVGWMFDCVCVCRVKRMKLLWMKRKMLCMANQSSVSDQTLCMHIQHFARQEKSLSIARLNLITSLNMNSVSHFIWNLCKWFQINWIFLELNVWNFGIR